MSNSTTKATSKGIRYTPEQKKEVVDFAVDYNAANGRGGQSKAAEKFNISQITVAAWLKGAGATPKSAKKAKAAKAPKAAKATKALKEGDTTKGIRYTDEQKQEVTDFVVSYNAANGGRGGPSNAAKKFNVSVLTVGAWLKRAGLKDSKKSSKPSKAVKSTKATPAASAASANKTGSAAPSASDSSGFDAKLNALQALRKQIASAEADLVSMNAKFTALKAAL